GGRIVGDEDRPPVGARGAPLRAEGEIARDERLLPVPDRAVREQALQALERRDEVPGPGSRVGCGRDRNGEPVTARPADDEQLLAGPDGRIALARAERAGGQPSPGVAARVVRGAAYGAVG